MAEESIPKEKVDEFVAKVSSLRVDENCKGLRPNDIVLMAARNGGIGSAVIPLTYAGLVRSVDCDGSAPEDARFWIEASVGVTLRAGGFEKDWIEAFNEQFFGKVSGVRDMLSPYQIKVSKDCAKRFRVMLQTAVALAESKGKVGKVSNNKCLGFRTVKYWSESDGWRTDDGFTTEDRELLKAIVGQGTIGSTASTVVPCEGEVADARKRAEEIQKRLNEEQRKSYQFGSQLQAAQRDLEKCKAELASAKQRIESDAESAALDGEKIEALRREIEDLRNESTREREVLQQRLDEMQRQAALADNKTKARNDAVVEVVTPICRQIDDVRGKPVSAEMGGVLLTHLNRIVDVLKENGFEV